MNMLLLLFIMFIFYISFIINGRAVTMKACIIHEYATTTIYNVYFLFITYDCIVACIMFLSVKSAICQQKFKKIRKCL